jgi:hypothetical protein
MVCALACTVFNIATAQKLTAVDDIVRTGPLEKVRAYILRNDTVPDNSYSWQIIPSSLPSASPGTLTKDGDCIVFTPNAACRDTAFDIRYELSGYGTKDTATVRFVVSRYSNPANVIYSDIKCVSEMTQANNFVPVLKYIGKSPGSTNYADVDRLDGFSMPLVGDLNGDGKPEIIAMGMNNGNGNTSLLEGLPGTGDKIIILNGQTGIEIFRYSLSNLKGTYKLRYDPRHNSVSKLAIADMDRNGVGDIVVTETGGSGAVHCIEPVFSGSTITGMTHKWTGWKGNPSSVASYKTPVTAWVDLAYSAAVPYISDINADGTPEVIVYNKIYNGVTGELVCTLETLADYEFTTSEQEAKKIRNQYAYVGRRTSAAWIEDHIPCMVIADINNDGILDIVAGSKVYVMKDEGGKPALERIIHGPISVTAQRGTGTGERRTFVNDGFTAVADVDLDGNPDVIVMAPAENDLNETTESLLYVWDPSNDPSTPKAATYIYTRSGTGTVSYPFVGDINGRNDDFTGTKRLPEICFNSGRLYTAHSQASAIAFHPLSKEEMIMYGITGASHGGHGFNFDHYDKRVSGHTVGFTYHASPDGSTPMHERLKLAWAMEHEDQSACTGITMFDFDNDNIKELCYRDERSLRIISPARKTYINYDEGESSTGAIRFKYSKDIGSYTGYEAPVIADVNMDGSADIVVLAYNDPQNHHSKGFVHVFEHASGTDMWAPCPPVWNQAIYFPLQINEDLTVPAKTQSILTKYEDGDGNVIYPYNGQWIQQPVVKLGEKYVPQVRKPDAILLDMVVSVTSATSAEATLTIRNGGSASIGSQTLITFYDGGTDGKTIAEGASRIGNAQPVGVDIFPGEKVKVKYTLGGDFNNHLIWARIVDDGSTFPAAGYLECDLSNNTFSGIHCPYLKYTATSASDTVVCGVYDSVTLTATPANSPLSTPTYQWYRDETPIPGATSQTYATTRAGEYRCYVTENICRGFSTPKTITHLLIPDVILSGTANTNHYASGDSLTVTLQATNAGLAALQAPFHIAAYKDAATAAGKMAADSSTVAVNTGDTTTVAVTIRNLSTYMPLNSIVIRINDRGAAKWIYNECEYGNNTATRLSASLLTANNDIASVVSGARVKVNVRANDSIPLKCSAPTLKITSPKTAHGSASVVNDSLQYIADPDFAGLDTVFSQISCTGDTSRSKTIVAVGKPLAAKYTVCLNALDTLGFAAVSGMKYFWYDAETGGQLIKATASDTIKRIKDSCAVQTFWAEPRYGQLVFPRHRVDMELKPSATASDIEINNIQICYDSTATLKADSHVPSPEYKWYDSQLPAATLLHAGATYPILQVKSPVKYYVSVSGTGYCENQPADRKEVSVDVIKTGVMPDIRINICPLPERQIPLTAFIDTLEHFSAKWTTINHAAPNITDTLRGTINSKTLNAGSTYTYRYSMSSKCGSASAIAYIHAPNRRMLRKTDTVVVCSSHQSSKSIHLNQIMGLDFNGEWKYDNPVNPDNTVKSNVKDYPASSSYRGALIFNACQAWIDAPSADYGITYKGNMEAKQFKFLYSAPNSCLGNHTKTLVIIVTKN